MTRVEFVDRLIAYCQITHASVTSYLRTPLHNEAVHGVTYSAHQVALAADVVYDEPLPLETRQEWAQRLGLRAIAEPGHDHLQPVDWQAG